MKIFLKIQSNTVFYMYLLSNNNIFSQKKIVYRSQRSYYNVRIDNLCVAECNTLRHFCVHFFILKIIALLFHIYYRLNRYVSSFIGIFIVIITVYFCIKCV